MLKTSNKYDEYTYDIHLHVSAFKTKNQCKIYHFQIFEKNKFLYALHDF